MVDEAIQAEDNMHPHDPRLRIRRLNRIVTGWQKHNGRMANILGCFGTDGDVEEAAKKLKAENADLKARIERLEAAFEPYADEKNWIDDGEASYRQLHRDDAKVIFLYADKHGYEGAQAALGEAKDESN